MLARNIKRIIQKTRIPARRTLSSVLAFVMMLSAVVVALPLMATFMATLVVSTAGTADAANAYGTGVAGINAAINNGDNYRAAELLPSVFLVGDTKGSFTGRAQTSTMSNPRQFNLTNTVYGISCTHKEIYEWLTAKAIPTSLITAVTEDVGATRTEYRSDGTVLETVQNVILDQEPSSGSVIKGFATSRALLYNDTRGWRGITATLSYGTSGQAWYTNITLTGSFSPDDANFHTSDPITNTQNYSRSVGKAIEEYDTWDDLPASIGVEGKLTITHTRERGNLRVQGVRASNDLTASSTNYDITSGVYLRSNDGSASTGEYGTIVRAYSDYLSGLSFTTTKSVDIKSVLNTWRNSSWIGINTTVEKLVEQFNLDWLDIMYAGAGNMWDTQKAICIGRLEELGMTNSEAVAVWDKYIEDDAQDGYKKAWMKKVDAAIAVHEALNDLDKFFVPSENLNPAGSDPNSGLWYGGYYAGPTNTFRDGGAAYTAAQALAKANAIAADQAAGGAHLLNKLDRNGDGVVTSADLWSMYNTAVTALDAAIKVRDATIPTSTDTASSGKSMLWFINEYIDGNLNGGENYGPVGAVPGKAAGVSYKNGIGYARADYADINASNIADIRWEPAVWTYNVKAVYAFMSWAESKKVIIDFSTGNYGLIGDFHVGANVDDDGNSPWNTDIAGIDPWDINLADGLDSGEEAQLNVAYSYKNNPADPGYDSSKADVLYSTVQIITLMDYAFSYKTVADMLKSMLTPDVFAVEFPDYDKLVDVYDALSDEYTYRINIFNDILGLAEKNINKILGYEPQWYVYRNWFKDNITAPADLTDLSVSQLATLFGKLKDKYAEYKDYEAKAWVNTDEDDPAYGKGLHELDRDSWWDEIFKMAIPMTVPADPRNGTTVPEYNWGKAVPSVAIDNTGFELAGRLQTQVEAAMKKYESYSLQNMLVWVAGQEGKTLSRDTTSAVANYARAYAVYSMVSQDIIGNFATEAEAIRYLNNTYVLPLQSINPAVPMYDNSIYTGSNYSSCAGEGYTNGRSAIGDYLFIVNVLGKYVKEFQADPVWSKTEWYKNGTQITGTYVTRYGDTVNLPSSDPSAVTGQDVARTTNEDYTVTGAQLKSLLDALDSMLGSEGDLSDILNAVGLDLSSLGLGVSGKVNAETVINAAVNNYLYSNEIVNTIVSLLYGLVLPMFENVFAGFSNMELPAELTNTTFLKIYSLHTLLANKGSDSLEKNVYYIPSENGGSDGNIQNRHGESNHNGISDLKLYPDLLGKAVKEYAAANGLTTTFQNAVSQLMNPTSYKTEDVGSGAINIDEPLVKWGAGGGAKPTTGYTYNVDTWRDPSIFRPTVNPDGTISYEYKTDSNGAYIKSGSADDPATLYRDESLVQDTTKPVGSLYIDWGINSLTGTARATQFKTAVGAALSGIYPLLQALLLGIDYVGFNPKVGYLSGTTLDDILGDSSNPYPTGWYYYGGNNIPIIVPTIYLKLTADGNEGFGKLVTPILELLAGLTTGTDSVYDAIPTVDYLKTLTYTKPTKTPLRKDQVDLDQDWVTAGTGTRKRNVAHFGGFYLTQANIEESKTTYGVSCYGDATYWDTGVPMDQYDYTYSAADTVDKSVKFVNALFKPIDAFIDVVGQKPLQEILRIIPNISYALSLDRISSLLEGALKTTITPEVNGLVQLGTPRGSCSDFDTSKLLGDMPNGALTGGSTFDTGNKNGNTQWKRKTGSPSHSLFMYAQVQIGWGLIDGTKDGTNGKNDPDPNLSTGHMEVANLVGAMDAIEVDVFGMLDLASLGVDAYLKAGSIENLLLGIMPDAAAYLPSDILDMTLGTYGPVKSYSAIPQKRSSSVQVRNYVDTEVYNLFYGILRSVLNPSTMGKFGLNLGNFDTGTAIAALMELHSPYGNNTGEPADGYAMKAIDYGTSTVVYNPFEFRDAHFSKDEAERVINKIIAALTGGVFFDLDGMIETLLGENVYNNATFDLVVNLLLSYIGPDGQFSDILSMVTGIVPELAGILEKYSDKYVPATYKKVEAKYYTYKLNAAQTAGEYAGEYTKSEVLPDGYVFKESGLEDDPATPYIDESLVCTNPTLAGTDTAVTDEDEHPGEAWNFTTAGDPQYPNYFWTDVEGADDGVIKDQASFFNAFYKLLSPLEDILRCFLMDEDFEIFEATNGTYLFTLPGYDGYEYGFIPLMEGLGFTDGLLTFTELKAKTGQDFIEGLFAPVFTALETVAEDPISFVLTGLPQILFFLFSDTAIQDSLMNLLKTPLVLLDTARPLYTIDISKYLDYLTFEGLLNNFGDVLNEKLGGLVKGLDLYDFLFGNNAAFLKSLVIGTVTLEDSKDGIHRTPVRTGTVYQEGTGGANTAVAMQNGKYPKIEVEAGEYFFSILIKALNYIYDNQSLLDSFLTDPTIKDIVLTFLENLQDTDNQHALFDALYQLLYGAHNVTSPSDVYKGYDDITPRSVTYDTTSGWTEAKALQFVNGTDGHDKELDFILNAVLQLVLGDGNDVKSILNGFLTGGELLGNSVMDPAVFSTAFFKKITGLLGGIVGDPSIASIIDIADDYITNLNINAFLNPDPTLGDSIDAAGAGLTDPNDIAQAKAEAFKDCIIEWLDPLAPLFEMLLTGKSLQEIGLYDPADPTKHEDGCEYLIQISGYYGYEYGFAPILAALGFAVPSFDTVQAAANPLDPILDCVIDTLYEIADHPITFVLDNLPNILAFVQAGALKKAAQQLITPVYALATAVDPLLDGIEIDGEPLDIIGMVDDILDYLDVKALLHDFLDTGISIGDATITINLEDLFTGTSSLIIGTKGPQYDADGYQLLVPAEAEQEGTVNYPATRVNSSREQVLTALVEYVVSLLQDQGNIDAIASLMGGTIPDFVMTVLDNVKDHPQTILNILYTIRFGADVTNDVDVWAGYANISANDWDTYVDGWTKDKANSLLHGIAGGEHSDSVTILEKSELDLIANWVIRYLGVKDMQGNAVDSSTELIESILGEYAYSPTLFETITNALQGITSGDGIADILAMVDELLPTIDLEGFLEADVLQNNFDYDIGGGPVTITINAGLTDPNVEIRKQAFVAALHDLLEPIAPILGVFLAGNSLEILDIDPDAHLDPLIKLNGSYGYNYGIVPLLEALGCEPMSYEDYQDAVAANDPVTPFITVIMDLVDTISANPIDWVLTNLPNIIAFAGDSNCIFNVINALLAPVYSLVNAVVPLAIGVEVDVLGQHIVIDENTAEDLLGNLLPSINLREILQSLLGSGIDLGSFTLNLDIDALLNALTIGEVKEYTSAAVDISAGEPLTGKKVVADQAGLITSLVTFLFETASVNKDDIMQMLNVTLTAPLDTILDNVIEHPQAVLNLIYHVKFGTGTVEGSLEEVYANYTAEWQSKVKTYTDYNTIWTKAHAEHMVEANANNDDDLSVIADSILNYVTGKTVGQTIEDIFGEQVYNPALFQKIVDAINSILGDPNLAQILTTVDELLDGVDLTDLMDTSDINIAATDTEAGFKAALDTLIAPLTPLFKVFLAGESYKTIGIDSTDADDTLITISGYEGYIYGIKPILEAFGATNPPTYADIQAASNPLMPIIDCLLDDIIGAVIDNPVDWVLTNLPNLIAFLDTGTLNKCLEQLLKPVLALVETVNPILEGVDPIEVIDGVELDLGDLAGSLLGSLDLKNIANEFLAPGIDIGGTKLTLDLQGIIDALLVGTVVEVDEYRDNNDTASKYGVSYRVVADKPGLLTSLVEYLLGTAVVANKDAIASLMGGQISEPINGILTTATENPKLILRILYNFLYADGLGTQSYITYDDGTALGISGDGSVLYREEWWTRSHAKYIWDRSDDFVNKLWAILFGKPLGSISGLIDDSTGVANSFITDLLGQALFTQENLTMIVNLVRDNVPADLLTMDVMGKPLAQFLKEGVFIVGANGAEGLDLEAILAPFNEYDPADPNYKVTDRDSFIAALVRLLSPAVPVLDVLLAGSDISIVPRTELGPDGEQYVVNVFGADGYKYGLLPLLEAIGIGIDKDAYLDVITTPEDYAVMSSSDKLYALLNPLLWVLEQVTSNPVENILRLVPNILYTIDGTNLQSCINKLIEPVNNVLAGIEELYHVDSISVTLDIPSMISGLLEGTGLEITYESLKALLIGQLVPYASKNGAPDAKYMSVEVDTSDGDNFMPDMLTALLRFVIMTFVATENNQRIVLNYLSENGLSGTSYTLVATTVQDIFTFIREGHISDIHGRYVLGCDIFLNALFILFYGMDKVVCKVYDTWQEVNSAITISFRHLLESHAYDRAYALNAAAFTNKYFPAVVTLDPVTGTGTVAPNGFIQFWLTIVAWFKKLFGFFFPWA
ncbi:MAG: hypothetical protein LBQ80_03850 [Clostridium sp.]|jgi:hypothetical protein|nr:hypothetical protein [Clostridium sp.]